jgi:hypothetical protein
VLPDRESGFSPETPAISRQKLETIGDADSSENRVLQDFHGRLRILRSVCHAEGRGFESLQPLRRRPAFAGLFRCGSRPVRLHPVGLIPDSSSPIVGGFKETPGLQAIIGHPN